MAAPSLSSATRSLALALALAGCSSLGNTPAPPRQYDLGLAPAVGPGSAYVGSVQMASPSWLRTASMQYRLAFEAPGERRSYTESRWAAAPPELLGGVLSRSLAGMGTCRLEVEVDEFLQIFPAPGHSEVLIETRIRLRTGNDGRLLASRPYSLRLPAPSADAAGGAQALATASRQLAEELAAWLDSLGRTAEANCTRT